MDLARTSSSFQSDLDFCPDCGSVLPLPGTQDAVICTRCGFSINVRGEVLLRRGWGGGGPMGISRSIGLKTGTRKRRIRHLYFWSARNLMGRI
uniref:DNA-directed RNA polymerase I subunit RPA12 n=1 Tax=Sus scrofa TaxID=9823 RepID=A0A480S2X4_PIG